MSEAEEKSKQRRREIFPLSQENKNHSRFSKMRSQYCEKVELQTE